MANSETSGRVAALATQTGAIDTSGITVLGIFGTSSDPRALVRLRSGKVRELARGARLNAWTVAAIDETGVILQRQGRTTRMPVAP